MIYILGSKAFFAAYNKSAIWMDELKPAFGEEKFFFEEEYEWLFDETINTNEKGFE